MKMWCDLSIFSSLNIKFWFKRRRFSIILLFLSLCEYSLLIWSNKSNGKNSPEITNWGMHLFQNDTLYYVWRWRLSLVERSRNKMKKARGNIGLNSREKPTWNEFSACTAIARWRWWWRWRWWLWAGSKNDNEKNWKILFLKDCFASVHSFFLLFFIRLEQYCIFFFDFFFF